MIKRNHPISLRSTHSLEVEWSVAIALTRVRFPVRASFLFCHIDYIFIT